MCNDEIPNVDLTPAMLDAGTFQYSSRDDILETPDEIVARIFVAMAHASSNGGARGVDSIDMCFGAKGKVV